MKNPFLCIALTLVLILGMTAGVYADVNMHDRIVNATDTINEFKQIPEKDIPPDVLKKCKGLAILNVVKAGLVAGVRTGSGLVIAKNAQTGTWSAPAAIDILGGSIGLQIGAEAVDLILVLNTDKAVQAFSKGNLTLGADISVAAGPYGRTAEGTLPDAYSYSRSKGLFAGISIEGMAIKDNTDVNNAYYGSAIPASEILSEAQLQPTSPEPAVDKLYSALTNL